MKRQIRRGTFETNSSSTHSICISKKPYNVKELPQKLVFRAGDFGWECRVHDDLETRTSYLYTAILELAKYGDAEEEMQFVTDSIKNSLNGIGIECEFEKPEDDDYYIDHSGETYDLVNDLSNDPDKLFRFLFSNSVIVTGNDNNDFHDDYMEEHAKDFTEHEIYYKGN